MSATQLRPARISPLVTFLALLWCLLLGSVHVVLAGAACTGGDFPVCVKDNQRDYLYRGVLVGRDGQPLPDTRFSVRFSSRFSSAPTAGFATDSHGSFCIRWAEEEAAPTFYVGNRVMTAVPTSGHDERQLVFPPRVSGPSPPGCQSSDAGIPWYHTSDPISTPESLSVIVLGLLGAGLLLAGLLLGVRVVGARLRLAGVGLTLATTAVAGVVWFVLPAVQ